MGSDKEERAKRTVHIVFENDRPLAVYTDEDKAFEVYARLKKHYAKPENGPPQKRQIFPNIQTALLNPRAVKPSF